MTATSFVGGMLFKLSAPVVRYPARRDDGDDMVWCCESVDGQTWKMGKGDRWGPRIRFWSSEHHAIDLSQPSGWGFSGMYIPSKQIK